MTKTKVHLRLSEEKPLGYTTSDPYTLSCSRICDLNMDLLTHSCKWDSAPSTMVFRDTCARLADETASEDHVG